MITEMVKDVKNVNQEGAKNIMSGRPNDKMFKTMVKKHGSEEAAREWFRSIGRRGGQNGNTGGFAANPELARIAGAKAGRISKRNHKYIKSDGQYNYYIANDTGKVVKSAKLTSAQRAEALGMFDKGMKRYEIAKHFNVSPSAIGRLLAGKTWAE